MPEKGVTKLDDFIHGPSTVACNGQEATVLEKSVCNVYGRAIVGAGRAEWDFRIDFESFGGIIVGLWRHDLKNKNDLSSLPLDKPFVKFPNGYGYTTKNGSLTHNGERKKYGKRFRKGQICTVKLDLTARTLSFWIDGEDQGMAYDSLPVGAYRLACKLQFPEQKVSLTRFWTSLEDHGFNDYETVATPLGANQDKTELPDIDNQNESKEPDQSNTTSDEENDKPRHEYRSSDPPPIVTNQNEDKEYPSDEETNTESSPDDLTSLDPLKEENETKTEEDNNNNNNDDNDNTEETVDNTEQMEDNMEERDDDDEEEKKIKSVMKENMHERTVSIHDIRKEIQHQRKRSGSYTNSLDEEKSGSGSDPENQSEKTIEMIGGRNRSSSTTPTLNVNTEINNDDENETKQSPLDRVEISKKDDEMVDSFMSYGANLNCIDDKQLVCIRSQDNVRHSAFGSQIISDGRMEWKLKIQSGHSIKIGVSGVSKITNDDFTSSNYGYGYGDDGCIYTNGSGVEYSDGYKAGDVVGVFLDMNNGTCKFTINDEEPIECFEDLKIDHENGVYGYKLAVSLKHRPHTVVLIESTRWETKSMSPRPVVSSTYTPIHQKRHSFGSNGLTSVNGKKDKKNQSTKSSTKSSKKSSPRTSDKVVKNGKKQNGKKKPTKTTNGKKPKKPTKTTTNGKKDTGKKRTGTKRNGTKNNNSPSKKKDRGKKTSTTGSRKKPKPSKTKTTTTKPGPKKPKKPKKTTDPKKTPRTNKVIKKPTSTRSTKTIEKSNVTWIEKKNCRDTWKLCGRSVIVERLTCKSKNTIQDGNSCFGTLEIKDNQKVKWDIKVGGDSVAIGIIQASDKSLQSQKNKYTKLLNDFFSNDRMGFGYYGKQSGIIKGGKYTKYGESFKTNDVITIELNTFKHTLKFYKNNTDLGIAYKNIPTGTYRLAVSFSRKMQKAIIKKIQVWEKR